MSRFIEGEDRLQQWLLPSCLDDYASVDNPLRLVEAYVDALDLTALGFDRAGPAATVRPPTIPGRC